MLSRCSRGLQLGGPSRLWPVQHEDRQTPVLLGRATAAHLGHSCLDSGTGMPAPLDFCDRKQDGIQKHLAQGRNGAPAKHRATLPSVYLYALFLTVIG